MGGLEPTFIACVELGLDTGCVSIVMLGLDMPQPSRTLPLNTPYYVFRF